MSLKPVEIPQCALTVTRQLQTPARWVFLYAHLIIWGFKARISNSAVPPETYFWLVSPPPHSVPPFEHLLPSESYRHPKLIRRLVLRIPPPPLLCDKLPLAWPDRLSALATVIAARSRMGHGNKLVSTYYNVGQMSGKEPSCPLILMAAISCVACSQTDNSFHLGH